MIREKGNYPCTSFFIFLARNDDVNIYSGRVVGRSTTIFIEGIVGGSFFFFGVNGPRNWLDVTIVATVASCGGGGLAI